MEDIEKELEKKELEQLQKKKQLKSKIMTITLFLIALILIIFYMSLPKQNEVKDIKYDVKPKEVVAEKTQEEKLVLELNSFLGEIFKNYEEVKILKIYFGDEIVYLKMKNKVDYETLNDQELKLEILEIIQKYFSIKEVKFI